MTFGIDKSADGPAQDRSPIVAARRVDMSEAVDAIPDAPPRRLPNVDAPRRSDLDQRHADMRDAAILNSLAVAKAHGMSPEWTEEDVARWRAIRAHTDAIAGGANEGETVPQGFGPPVRARQTAALLRAVAKPDAADQNG